MNLLDVAAIMGLVLTLLIYYYSARACKARLAREEEALDVKLRKEHEGWHQKLLAREAALQPPSEN